jgi:DNA polymerase III subunit gamma/tau
VPSPPASAQVDQPVTPPEFVKASEPISANLANLASSANEPILANLASSANEPISANLASLSQQNGNQQLVTSEPTIQPAAIPPRARRTAFSLKDIGLKPEPAIAEALASDHEEKIEVPHTERNLRPFTQQALDNAWKDAEQLFHDAPMVKSLIQTVLPVLEGDAVIRVSIENDLQQTLMLAERDRLVPFLRQILQNDSIKLQTVVQEGSVNAKLVYTPDERFAFLLEKNPHLDEFRREFQLDIE